MKKEQDARIIYAWKSVDGTTHTIMAGENGITEMDIATLNNLDRLDYNNDQKVRRHWVSLGMFTEDNPDKAGVLADHNALVEALVIQQVEMERLHVSLREALSALSESQRNLLVRVYTNRQSIRSIARAEGVYDSAIHARLRKIYARLKKSLE